MRICFDGISNNIYAKLDSLFPKKRDTRITFLLEGCIQLIAQFNNVNSLSNATIGKLSKIDSEGCPTSTTELLKSILSDNIEYLDIIEKNALKLVEKHECAIQKIKEYYLSCLNDGFSGDDKKSSATEYFDSLQILFDNEQWVLLLKWMIVYSVVWDKISQFAAHYIRDAHDNLNNTVSSAQIAINKFFSKNSITRNDDANSGFIAVIPEDHFGELRKLIISTTQEEITIAGASLCRAFSDQFPENIIETLLNRIELAASSLKDKLPPLKKVNILITDPNLFSGDSMCSAIRDLKTTIETLISRMFAVFREHHCELNIYFLPLTNIDHAVISDQYMFFRTTKLWEHSKTIKGSLLLYRKPSTDKYATSEYIAHQRYLDRIMEISTVIDVDIDSNEITSSTDEAHSIHQNLRNAIKNGNYKSTVKLYKLYRWQLLRSITSEWQQYQHLDSAFFACEGAEIQSREDLFNPNNLLGDKTQQTLLPYIKETESIFTSLIRTKYDRRKDSKGKPIGGAVVIPSLDLGYPNNAKRLAGGFATGMVIDWECGTPIIPIDATVNVCSSSVFYLGHCPTALANDIAQGNKNCVFTEFIERVFQDASSKKEDGPGYSFSFNSGNHFLMIALDKAKNDYYLVMHSSVSELKDSYLGLYPNEGNWYWDKIKKYPSPEGTGRYLRYIKADEAVHFTRCAHNMENYNIQIHTWLASEIGWESPSSYSLIKHHYYMPTDSSIAIGTFVEKPETDVPLFSDVKKPVYIFRIGANNWRYNFGGTKGSCCLIPHGWGQQIEQIDDIRVDCVDESITLCCGNNTSTIHVNRAKHIDDHLPDGASKNIRSFTDGEHFLSVGGKMIQGQIIKTLTPVYLYCKSHIGLV